MSALKIYCTSKSLTSVCGVTLFDSMFTFSRALFDSTLPASFAAAKSPRVVFAIDKSSNVSLVLNASKMAINCFSDTGTLFKFTLSAL